MESVASAAGNVDPALERSMTVTSAPLATGFEALSAITLAGPFAAATTNETLGEDDPSGFRIWIGRLPAKSKSAAVSVVEQSPALAQIVVLGIPEITIRLPEPPAPATKLPPSVRNENPPAAPAAALAGNSCVITAAVDTVTAAVPIRDVSTSLVAEIVIASGDGAETGAVNRPLPSICPQAPAVPHAAPPIFQVTLWSGLPMTFAENCTAEFAATAALGGDTLTTT